MQCTRPKARQGGSGGASIRLPLCGRAANPYLPDSKVGLVLVARAFANSRAGSMTATGPAAASSRVPKPLWSEHKADNGRSFWYNRKTKQRTWKRPAELPPPTSQESATTAAAAAADIGKAETGSRAVRAEARDAGGGSESGSTIATSARSPSTASAFAERRSFFDADQKPRASKLALYAYYAASLAEEEIGRPSITKSTSKGDADSDSGRPPSDSGDTGANSVNKNGFILDDDGFWVRLAFKIRPFLSFFRIILRLLSSSLYVVFSCSAWLTTRRLICLNPVDRRALQNSRTSTDLPSPSSRHLQTKVCHSGGHSTRARRCFRSSAATTATMGLAGPRVCVLDAGDAAQPARLWARPQWRRRMRLPPFRRRLHRVQRR